MKVRLLLFIAWPFIAAFWMAILVLIMVVAWFSIPFSKELKEFK